MLHSRFSLHTYFTCGGCDDLVTELYPTLCNPMDCVAHQASLSMRFPRKDYWNGLPFPSLGDPPNPRIELPSPALAGRFFTTESPGKPPTDAYNNMNLSVLFQPLLKRHCLYKAFLRFHSSHTLLEITSL